MERLRGSVLRKVVLLKLRIELSFLVRINILLESGMELFDLHNLVAHSVHTVQFTHQKFNKFPLVPRVLSVSKLLFLFDNQLIL